MDKKQIKIIKQTIDELFKLLEIEGAYKLEEKEDGGIEVLLDTPDSGIIIGFHGDTIEALQLVISLCVSKKLGEFKRISVEVGDYKKNRTEWLKSLAMDIRERVVVQKREIAFPKLKSWERRIVHILLQDDKEVASQSVGEGNERVLVVSPKS